jgi:hypothetical protein
MSSDNIELFHAHLEADCNEAEDAYFKARPQIIRTFREEALFRAGFQRAYAKLWTPERAEKETPHAPTCDCEGPQKVGADWHTPQCSLNRGVKP